MRLLMIAVAFLFFPAAASAAQRCPAGYFVAGADNEIAGSDSRISPQVCALFLTSAKAIRLKVIGLA